MAVGKKRKRGAVEVASVKGKKTKQKENRSRDKERRGVRGEEGNGVRGEEGNGVRNKEENEVREKEENEVRNKEGKGVKGKDENVLQDGEEIVVKNKEENVVKDKEENVVQDSDENVVKDKEENVVKDKEENVVQDSDENVVKDKEENAVQDSDENAVKDKEGNAVQDSDENAVKNKERKVMQDKEEKVVQDKEEHEVKNKNESEQLSTEAVTAIAVDSALTHAKAVMKPLGERLEKLGEALGVIEQEIMESYKETQKFVNGEGEAGLEEEEDNKMISRRSLEMLLVDLSGLIAGGEARIRAFGKMSDIEFAKFRKVVVENAKALMELEKVLCEKREMVETGKTGGGGIGNWNGGVKGNRKGKR